MAHRLVRVSAHCAGALSSTIPSSCSMPVHIVVGLISAASRSHLHALNSSPEFTTHTPTNTASHIMASGPRSSHSWLVSQASTAPTPCPASIETTLVHTFPTLPCPNPPRNLTKPHTLLRIPPTPFATHDAVSTTTSTEFRSGGPEQDWPVSTQCPIHPLLSTAFASQEGFGYAPLHSPVTVQNIQSVSTEPVVSV